MCKKSFIVYLLCFLGIIYASNAFPQCSANQISQELMQIKKAYKITAITVIMQSPDCHYSFHKGWMTIEKNRHIKSDTKFGVGSITKTFVSTIVLMLQNKGKLDLNGDIGKWFPQYPRWKSIKVIQLLNMTSGIYNYFEDSNYNKDLNAGFKKNWTREQLIRLAYSHPGYFSPGKGWNYSDTNYLILSDIIEKITHQSLKNNIYNKIFRKFHLNNSFYIDGVYPNKIVKETAIGYLNKHPFNRNSGHNIGAPAAAMLMSAQDLANWVDDLLVKKIVLPKSQFQKMITGVKIPDNYEGSTISNSKYGLGVPMTYSEKYGLIYWYTGITPWHTSTYVYIPKKRALIIVETSFNRSGEKNRYMLFLQKPIMQKLIGRF